MNIQFPQIAPLSPDLLEKIQQIEESAFKGICACGIPGTEFLNPDKAFEVMSVYGCAELDIRLSFYIHRTDFKRETFGFCVIKTIDSMLCCFPAYEFRLIKPDDLRTHESPVQFIEPLEDVLWRRTFEHAKTAGLIKSLSDDLIPAKQPPVLIPASSPEIPDQSLVQRRAKMLEQYRAATGASKRSIYTASASGIHKPQFYEWEKGILPEGSATTINFERFLQQAKPPIRRKSKR